jgi:hypothetical protein
MYPIPGKPGTELHVREVFRMVDSGIERRELTRLGDHALV